MQQILRKQTPDRPLKWRLFGYMMSLAVILLLALIVGLFLLGRFGSVRKDTHQTLDIQMQVFSKEVSTQYDNLSFRAIQLSEELSSLLENHFLHNGGSLQDLTNQPDQIKAVQDLLFAPLKQKLLQSQCSGAFLLLDTTINDTIPNAEHSRSGLYLQPCHFYNSDADVLLYRGIAQTGKENGAMLHRKWRQEFRTDQFPNYETFFESAQFRQDGAYRVTDIFTLPGTSEQAMLLTAPLIGKDGTFYGICGFEISESYFKQQHAQATKLEHLTCLLAKEKDGTLYASKGLSAGITSGYYFAPKHDMGVEDINSDLKNFKSSIVSHIGIMQSISLSENDSGYVLAVMIPKVDYTGELVASIIQLLLLLLLLVFFAVSCCLFFSRHFLKPVLNGLEILKHRRNNTTTNIPEMDDLFHFLAAQDRAHEQTITLLEQQKQDAANQHARIESEYAAAQAELARLAYERDKEIDPNDYRQFLCGIQTFTPAERNVFQYYLEGKNAKDIQQLMNIKESTLRYHNRNIYQKLGVNSLKQMLRYAALMKQKSQQESEL